MKKQLMNFLFLVISVGSIGFLSSCNKDDETPSSSAEFDTTLNNTGIVLFSQYASTATGSFYASKTKTIGTSTSSTPEDVDITYADIAISATDDDVPTFVSPDYRSNVNQTGTNGPITNLANAGTTYFKATSLDLGTATAQQVSDEIKDIGTERSITITGAGTNYIYTNSTAGTSGIIKVTELLSAGTSTSGQSTTNVRFDIKVLKK